MALPTQHNAVVMTGPQGQIALKSVPTPVPKDDEVLVHQLWTASTPLDMHQADSGLLVKHPQVMGDGTAGHVVAVGPAVKNLKVGDAVFGFTWRSNVEKSHQEYVLAPEYLFGIVPAGRTFQEGVTLGNNFVTVFHALTADLQIPLPWPKPEDYVPSTPYGPETPILIWGASSSVGQYAIQVLRHWGYTRILGTASKKHHEMLRSLAEPSSKIELFDYRDVDVVDQINTAASDAGGVKLLLDCIGSLKDSIAPSTRVLSASGSIYAVLLPVIVKPSTPEHREPEYTMDAAAAAAEFGSPFKEGVKVEGVRTHFYLDNPLWKEKLQPEIMPDSLANGWCVPNKQRIVEGANMLERAEKALDLLRSGTVSGERLVWKVADK